MKTIGIRVSTSENYGKGHIERCLTIRKYIAFKVIWFIDYFNSSIEKKIPKEDKIYYEDGIDKVDNLKKNIIHKQLDLIFIDSYNIKTKELYDYRENIPIAVIIDSNINVYANMIICPQPINLKLNKSIKYLTGPNYAPVAEDFYLNYKKKITTKNILISFGAYDSKGITLKVIKAVKNIFKANNYKYNMYVMLGAKSPILDKVKVAIKDFSYFKLLVDEKNIASIYKNCYFAIGAPGLSHMERLSSGLPSLLIAQNIKHEVLIEKWASISCGIQSKNTISSIENNVRYMLKNEKILNKIKYNGRLLIDGKGAMRISKELHKLGNLND